MKAALVMLALALGAVPAHAQPLPDAIAAKIVVPADLVVSHVYAPASVEKLDVNADDLVVEAPREPRPGRSSVRVQIGKQTVWVQVVLVRAADGDKKSDPNAQLVARSTKVTVTIHKGAVVVHASAVLEAAARVGDEAQVMISATHVVVRGTLVTPDTVEVSL